MKINLKRFFKKRYIFALVFILFIVFFTINKNNNGDALVEVVERGDLKQSVLATGQVISETDLDLSFNTSGIVKNINVKVGDKVNKGKVLASLDQGSLLASLTQARGELAKAQAKYEDTILGSSDAEVSLARILLENAKKEYDETKIEHDSKLEKELNELSIGQENKKHLGVLDDYNIVSAERKKALASAQSLIDQRQAELDLKVVGATDPEIALAQAEILSAQGQVELAQANLENSIIRAPASGTVTKVDIELGELAQANQKSITIEDVEKLYVEAKINEANITSVNLENFVFITYDAFGPTEVFEGRVVFIDPSSTTEEGVVNYKIKVLLAEDNTNIKPGMNADLTIVTFEKNNVLLAPMLSITEKDGLYFIKTLQDSKKKTYKEIPVVIGKKGDGNIVEIIEGVNEGESVVITTK